MASVLHGPDVRALLQRTSGASVRVGGELLSSIGPGLVVLLGVGHDDDATPPMRWRNASRSSGSSGTTRAAPTDPWWTSARRRSCRSSPCSRTRAEGAGPASRGRRHPIRRSALYQRFAASLRARHPGRDGSLRGRDGGGARERRTVHDLARHRRPLGGLPRPVVEARRRYFDAFSGCAGSGCRRASSSASRRVEDERLQVRLHSDGGHGRGSCPMTAG